MGRVLALSGGGFRATLFHLGVVRYLIETKNLCEQDTICSVSGGSVLAAHLVLNWERYKNLETFPSAAREIIAFVQKDVRGQVFGWWIACRFLSIIVIPLLVYWVGKALALPFWWSFGLAALFFALGVLYTVFLGRSRIALLESEYETLYQQGKLRALRPEEKPRPKVYLLSTDLWTGELCGFSDDGLYRVIEEGTCQYREVNVPVAFAVAASSGFPPAFPPARLPKAQLGAGRPEYRRHVLLFTDGGVFDNSGVAAGRLIAIRHGEEQDYFVSNAEQRSKEVKYSPWRFRLLMFRAWQASNIVMGRVGNLQEEQVQHGSVFRLAECSSKKLDGELLERVRNMRTDLNKFNEIEIQLLIHFGYTAAREKLQQSEANAMNGGTTKPLPVIDNTAEGLPYIAAEGSGWLPFSKEEMEGANPQKNLANSEKSPLLRPIFRSLMRWWIMLPCLAIVAVIYYRNLMSFPSSLAFQSVFPSTTAKEDEKRLIEETDRNTVLSGYKESLLRKPRPDNTQQRIFFAFTRPLGEYCRGQDPAAFMCRITCRDPRFSMQVAMILKRASKDGVTYEFLQTTEEKAFTTFSVPACAAGDQLIAIGRVVFQDGERTGDLNELIHLEVQK